MEKKNKNSEFDLVNLPIEAQDPEIKQEDFVLQKNEGNSFEQKFQTKPTTFLKDSIKRFAKNKSSVVASVILGLLVLLSIFVPVFDQNDITSTHPAIDHLTPKLFDGGTGFWDGRKWLTSIPVDTSEMPDATTEEEKQKYWWPTPSEYPERSVFDKKFTKFEYLTDNKPTTYSNGGYVRFSYQDTISDSEDYYELKTANIDKLSLKETHYLSTFDVYDFNKMKKLDSDAYIPSDEVGKVALYAEYTSGGEEKEVEILPYESVHNIGSAVEDVKEDKINITEKIKAVESSSKLSKFHFSLRLKNLKNHKQTSVYIKSIEFESESVDEATKEAFIAPSFHDASECLRRTSKSKDSIANPAYWDMSNGVKSIHMAKTFYCDFSYDVYEDKLGVAYSKVSFKDLEKWNDDGIIKMNVKLTDSLFNPEIDHDNYSFEIIDKVECPLAAIPTADDFHIENGEITYVFCDAYQYKLLGLAKNGAMPKYLFGTDKNGYDMLKYVFEGTRTSLILGLLTTAICFIFGLIWGAICGYFGGTVDLVMERFTDILAGVPWIVVMTLIIIKFGSTFATFAIALCMTGWIGTAATTRTQFYRFRGREYVLASRTLGASDARLIAKHILPNAMGTIITSAVLMVPSVIFSEATISYLGLGFRNLASLGVILSENQAELQTYPYLLLFPSAIIALLMISFNLFGNGLRDAVNPSLKGEDE